jgi:hypothetical protein
MNVASFGAVAAWHGGVFWLRESVFAQWENVFGLRERENVFGMWESVFVLFDVVFGL